jgi:tripartite-type tricarboxylate transporter receptor subunit TctC
MNIGAGNVARATPDGYTLLVAPPSPLSFNHLLFRELGYEPTKFVPITMLAKIPNVLVVRKDLPASTLKELIDYGKANPGKLSYASQGVGSTAHLSAAQLEAQAGIKMVHVPYRGGGPAMNDAIAGHVDFIIGSAALVMPQVSAATIRPLLQTGKTRMPTLPAVPNAIESGFSDFESYAWWGVFAPAGTPKPIQERFGNALIETLREPGISKQISENLQVTMLLGGPEDERKFLKAQMDLWGPVVQENNIKGE